MRTLELTRMNEKYTVSLVPAYYMDDQSLSIQLLYKVGNDWEPYGSLTTNLGESSMGRNNAYVDTNNLGNQILDWIKKNDLGEPTGRMKQSGFCRYPEVHFNEEALKKFDNPDYRYYLESQEELSEDGVRLYSSCEMCEDVYPITVTQEQADMYEDYLHNGKYLIQEVFPGMSNEMRGLFARGQHICGKCWKEMFGIPDDDDYIEEDDDDMEADDDSEE